MGKKIKLKDIKKKKQKENKIKIINTVIFVLLLSSVIFLSLISYVKTKNINILKEYKFLEKYIVNLFEKDEDKIYLELNFDLSQKPKISVYNGNIAQCSKDVLKIYNRYGKLQNSFNVNFTSTPILSSEGRYLVVSSIDGNRFLLFDGVNKKWERKLEGNIINISVNKNGFVTVVHKAEDILSKVVVYNSKGEEYFVKGKAQNYIVSAKMAKDDRQLILNCMDASGVRLNSIFEFIDVKGKSVQTVSSYEDKIFMDGKFIKDNNFVTLTDKEIMYYNSNHNILWEKSLNRKVYCFDVCDDRYIVLGMASDKIQDGLFSDKTELKIFNTKGNEVKTLKIDNIIKGISVYGDVIALNLGKEIALYTCKGKHIKSLTSKLEVEKAELVNKSTVVLLTKNGLIVKN